MPTLANTNDMTMNANANKQQRVGQWTAVNRRWQTKSGDDNAGMMGGRASAVLYSPPPIPIRPLGILGIPTNFQPTSNQILTNFRPNSEEFWPTSNQILANFPPDSDQLPTKFWPNSKQILTNFQPDSNQLPTRFQPTSDQIPSRFQADSNQIPSRFHPIE